MPDPKKYAEANDTRARMKLVRSRPDTQHRGYRIEGEKKGDGWILRLTATRAGLPMLPWWRFRTLRAPWAKAIIDVARYIDEALAEIANRNQVTAAKHEEEIRLSRLHAELQRLRDRMQPTQPTNAVVPAAAPNETSEKRIIKRTTTGSA